MREAVSDLGGGGRSSGGSGQGPALGKVWAIAERPVNLTENPDNARVLALVVTSKLTPHTSAIGTVSPPPTGGNSRNALQTSSSASRRVAARRAIGSGGGGGGGPGRRSGGGGSSSSSTAVAVSGVAATAGGGVVQRAMQWRKSHLYPARSVAPGPPVVVSPGGSAGFAGGLLPRDVDRVVALPELGTQPYSNRREVLCLTGAGLQTLAKMRPVDMLYELLAQDQAERVSDGFGGWVGWRRGGGGGRGRVVFAPWLLWRTELIRFEARYRRERYRMNRL